MPAPSASDVPTKFDCLIDGAGYVFDDTLDAGSVYAQHQRAEFGLSPVFIERQNTQGNYGDNQQDFWLTSTQKDWSLGEQQRFFRANDEESVRQYWLGSYVDVHTEGQVAMSYLTASGTAAQNIECLANAGTGVYVFGSTNGYLVNQDGTFGGATAHNLGTSPKRYGTAWDGTNLFISSTSAGTVGVRNFTGASTFSASGADSLAFLNNTLYGYRKTGATGDLVRWDTAGALTSLYTWKTANGGILNFDPVVLRPYGGKLLILLNNELWIYDGTAPSLIYKLPPDFVADSLCIAEGIAFVGGTNGYGKPAIYYYANGTPGLLWESTANGTSTVGASMVEFRSGLFFSDPAAAQFFYYNAKTGGVSSIGEYASSSPTSPMMAATIGGAVNFVAFVQQQTGTNVVVWPKYSGSTKLYATTSTVFSSTYDFDSSLNKIFRGIKVDFDSATDGNGGSVDISYRLNDPTTGSVVALQTGAVSGTEYSLSGITGRSIQVIVQLNKGTSTAGPKLKRIAVRAAPVQPQYIRASYALACYGSPGPPSSDEESRVTLRDNTSHTKSGLEMVADIKTAAAKSSISITDEVNGTFTGVIEADSVRFQRHRTGEYRVFLTVRQI